MVNRPFLNPSPVFNNKEDRVSVCYHLNNSGNIPARIVFNEFMTWRDGVAIEKREGPSSGISIAYTDSVYISRCANLRFHNGLNIRTVHDMLNFFYKSKTCVEIASCIIYQSIDKNDPRQWQIDVRHTLNKPEKISITYSDEKEISEEVVECKIDPPQVCKKR